MRRVLCVVLLAGCPDPDHPPDVELYGLTGAPPASTASITNDEVRDIYSVELSTGVAIATRCWTTCSSTCLPKVVVENTELLDVRPVYRVNGAKGELALIAKRPGTTLLTVDSGCAHRTYALTVLPR